jgi:ATP-dependent Clp protease adaptor protein ClpS
MRTEKFWQGAPTRDRSDRRGSDQLEARSAPIGRVITSVRRGEAVVLPLSGVGPPMSNNATKPRTKVKLKTERPRLHKVILVNDDYTPREFVVMVLKGEFRMNEDQAYRVMITAHRRGSCVVAVYTKDIAETKAARATQAGCSQGYPLLFTTEPEE